MYWRVFYHVFDNFNIFSEIRSMYSLFLAYMISTVHMFQSSYHCHELYIQHNIFIDYVNVWYFAMQWWRSEILWTMGDEHISNSGLVVFSSFLLSNRISHFVKIMNKLSFSITAGYWISVIWWYTIFDVIFAIDTANTHDLNCILQIDSVIIFWATNCNGVTRFFFRRPNIKQSLRCNWLHIGVHVMNTTRFDCNLYWLPTSKTSLKQLDAEDFLLQFSFIVLYF